MSVSLRNVTKVFKDVIAVDNVSLDVKDGEFLTLLGPSGCGKTTTLRIVAGFETPTSGEIFIEDRKVNDIPPYQRNTGMVFQSYALFPHLSVFENIAFGLRLKGFSESEIKDKVRRVVEMLGLAELTSRNPSQLSGGQQQRVALARALVVEPKVLLLDEPLSNLDAKLRMQMRVELRKLQQSLSITSIYVTHDQSEAMSMADRIVVMNEGKVQQVGTPWEIYGKPANRFVADFIGRVNIVDAKIVEMSDESTIIEMLGKEYTIDFTPKGFSIGDEVLVILRPESIEICPPGGGDMDLTVDRRVYLGASVEYYLKDEDLSLMVTEANPQHKGIHSEGEKIGIRFLRDCMHFIRS
ncbi:MAG: ABC transporter ATP-binding protein [Synergistetes bacterium]|nr:ABC transporter ATP-binding protein [Synergistota bacterium]